MPVCLILVQIRMYLEVPPSTPPRIILPFSVLHTTMYDYAKSEQTQDCRLAMSSCYGVMVCKNINSAIEEREGGGEAEELCRACKI